MLHETECFHTEKDIGRVAVALAKRCFFGEQALTAATLYGKQVSSQKLKELKAAIEQTQPFKNKTPSEVETLCKACLKAIAASCKGLRKNREGKQLRILFFCAIIILCSFPCPHVDEVECNFNCLYHTLCSSMLTILYNIQYCKHGGLILLIIGTNFNLVFLFM